VSGAPLPAALQPHRDELRSAAQAEPIGLYLHVPFCKDRCTYCSFVTTRDQSLQSDTVAKLIADVRLWGEALGRPAVDTLYLGGGTPSLLSHAELHALTQATREAFDLAPLEEATLEANPGTVDAAWLSQALDLGWDRISLGTQTLDDALLRHLGRIHNGNAALEAMELAARAGFSRRSGDLMVGIPGQDLHRVLSDAKTMIATGLEHMSIYLLDLDKACPLKAEVDAGRLALPSEDEVAEVFEALQTELPALGLPGYEISNYAKPGAESRHNRRYWERRPYLGLGPSAASHLGSLRFTESGVLPAWLEGRGEFEITELDTAEALGEVPLLGLRLHQGIDWSALRQRAARERLLPLVDGWESHLRRYAKEGLVAWEGERVRLTPRGMLMSNGILQLFV
jgi:oxygen-independent coproporphyrinogen-3 oxidase